MEQNLFERASREAFRYESSRGLLTTEQLWDLPLTSKNGFDLDTVAKGVNGALKDATEESFVSTPKATSNFHEARLLVVKHVIACKLQERQEAADKVTRAEKRRKLLDLLAKKQDAALEGMTEEQIRAELEALG